MAAKSFDQNDWDAFSGAESFPNGDQPLIDASDERILYIASANNIEAHESSLVCDDRDPGVWALHIELPNASIAALILNNLPGTIEELQSLGFVRIN